MKILYVTTVIGTVNAFLIPHIEMLIESGYEVHIVSNLTRDVDKNLKRLDVKIHNLKFNRSPLSLDNLKTFKELKDILIANKYDIIHTHTPVASAIVRIACRSLENVKVIYTAHGFHFYDGAPIKNWVIYYSVEKFLSKYTDILVTINKEDYKRALTFKAKQVKYIPGVGIDLKDIKINNTKISKIKNEADINEDDFVLCSIGEINRNKNHNIVLEALYKIGNTDIKYLIIGTGELKEELIEKAKKLKLEKQVKFLGFRDDIYEILALSDVYVFPSMREGLSRSLMEAMAVGKPVIASDIRGNRDLIDDKKGGLLFNPGNTAQLSEHIITMLNNESFRKTASTYNTEKVKQFSLENVLNKMSKIY